MTAFAGAGLALLAAGGVLMIVAAALGVELPSVGRFGRDPSESSFDVRPGLVAVAVALGVVLVTQVVALGLLVAAAVVAVPLFRQAKIERAVVVDRTEALATWAESLRDHVRSHAGLRQAVVLSLSTVDEVIRPQVEGLAQDLASMSPEPAFARFSERIGDPVGDLLATALTVALGDSGASDLPKLLGQLASDARDEVTGIRQVAVKHDKTFTTVRTMMMVVAGTTSAMFLLQGSYMAQYATPEGQVVLVGVVAVVVVALWGLVRMARPVRPIRVLAGPSR